MGLPAASGWTEQKRGWELRPERQWGQVLDDIAVGFGSDSQRADTGAERLETRGCQAPAAGGRRLALGAAPGSLPIRAS